MLVELSVVEQRYHAVMEISSAGAPVVEVAAHFGASRKTAHAWVRRYRDDGLAGLADCSHRPPAPPAATGGDGHCCEVAAEAMAEDEQVVHHLANDERLAAVCAALEPYPWWGFTAEMLARRVLGATDAHRVLDLVAGIPGAHPGALGHVEPVDRGDERVEVLVEFLAAHHWRAVPLAALGGRLLGVLDAWWLRRQWLEVESGWLADGDR